jgi:hypothetical protein
MDQQKIRLVREVVTERDLLHLGGTFYELPAENADGYAKIKPISTHTMLMNDFASFRGMLVISGVNAEMEEENERVIRSEDSQLAVWTGVVDDLWKLGRPKGKGGPWTESKVAINEVSDPYLFGGYDQRTLLITNHGEQKLLVQIEVDPTGSNDWHHLQQLEILPSGSHLQKFDLSINAKWIRFVALSPGIVTTELLYD